MHVEMHPQVTGGMTVSAGDPQAHHLGSAGIIAQMQRSYYTAYCAPSHLQMH